jgi:hypothetical protein
MENGLPFITRVPAFPDSPTVEAADIAKSGLIISSYGFIALSLYCYAYHTLQLDKSLIIIDDAICKVYLNFG